MNPEYDLCIFCNEETDTHHFCAKRFIFRNIFEGLFMKILLEQRPQNRYDFWNIAMDVIEAKNLFSISSDRQTVAYEHFLKFLEIYDCF